MLPRRHAKELGVWHGLGAPPGAPPYYGAAAHDGRTRYLALDGAPMGAVSLCEKEGYHNGRFVKAKLAVLLCLARATGRALLEE